MNLALVALMLAASLSAPCASAQPLALSDDTLDAALDPASGEVTLLEFYSPFCGHCRQLQPIMDVLSRELSKFGIRTAQVDGTKNSASANSFGVRAYPDLFLVNSGHRFA
jgi:thiol-disulfide isomerase/thioredoxin